MGGPEYHLDRPYLDSARHAPRSRPAPRWAHGRITSEAISRQRLGVVRTDFTGCQWRHRPSSQVLTRPVNRPARGRTVGGLLREIEVVPTLATRKEHWPREISYRGVPTRRGRFAPRGSPAMDKPHGACEPPNYWSWGPTSSPLPRRRRCRPRPGPHSALTPVAPGP